MVFKRSLLQITETSNLIIYTNDLTYWHYDVLGRRYLRGKSDSNSQQEARWQERQKAGLHFHHGQEGQCHQGD